MEQGDNINKFGILDYMMFIFLLFLVFLIGRYSYDIEEELAFNYQVQGNIGIEEVDKLIEMIESDESRGCVSELDIVSRN